MCPRKKNYVTDLNIVVKVDSGTLVKLEQNLSIFKQDWYMIKNVVLETKNDVTDLNIVVKVVMWEDG
jgi:hypothetical protein